MSKREFPEETFYKDQRERFLRKYLVQFCDDKALSFVDPIVECLTGLPFPVPNLDAAVKVVNLYYTGDREFALLCIKYDLPAKLTTQLFGRAVADPDLGTGFSEAEYILHLGKNTDKEPPGAKALQFERYIGDKEKLHTANTSASKLVRALYKKEQEGLLAVAPSEIDSEFTLEEDSDSDTSTTLDEESSEVIVQEVVYTMTTNPTPVVIPQTAMSASEKVFTNKPFYDTYLAAYSDRAECVNYADEQKRLVDILESIMLTPEQCSALDQLPDTITGVFVSAWLKDIKYTGFDPIVIISIMKSMCTCDAAFPYDIAALVSLFLMRGTSIVLDSKLSKMSKDGAAKVKSLVNQYRIKAKVTDHQAEAMTVITLSRIAASFPITTLTLLKKHKQIERPVTIKQMTRAGYLDFPPAARTSTAFAIMQPHDKGTEGLIKAILQYQIMESKALMSKADKAAYAKLDTKGKNEKAAQDVESAKTYALAAYNSVLVDHSDRAELSLRLFGNPSDASKAGWIEKWNVTYPDFVDIHLEFVGDTA